VRIRGFPSMNIPSISASILPYLLQWTSLLNWDWEQDQVMGFSDASSSRLDSRASAVFALPSLNNSFPPNTTFTVLS
jgi:hypothetical protein